MASPKSVCVFCGSSEFISQDYKDVAHKLGKVLVQEGIRLIYGGSRMGLMGVIADSVMSEGGQAIGFIPQTLHEFEIGHDGLTELHIVDSMHDRKRLMFEYSDAIIVLPGGFGTLDEATEIITWRQIRLHSKPIVILNINDYWTNLFDMFVNHMIQNKFVRPEHRDIYYLASTIKDVMAYLKAYAP
ncbi:MAG: TIGR00730 family Rossman fold protein [Alphaproteobacteria bacterium]|nr:TIGR00730 family Rossman fold protein [Alphaproteobacteria bacterium]